MCERRILETDYVIINEHNPLYDDYDDYEFEHHPYTTCFVFQGVIDYCWSRTYFSSDGDWEPCNSKGYFSGEWTIYAVCNDNTDFCVAEASTTVADPVPSFNKLKC